MLHLVMFLLTLSGVLSQKTDWGVNYLDSPICVVRGFSVSIPCYYYYPQNNQVTQMLWCSMNSNTGGCKYPPYVYDSSSHTKSDFVYAGDNKSDCTLIIHNVPMNYTGEYKFRFITNKDRWTGEPGVNLQVADLKVSLIRLSGNGTLKQGDAVNLTCDVNCTQTSSQFVWSKNNERLPEPGSVLHFPALTVRDSGNYTCTWKSNVTSGSETISLHVEASENPAHWPVWLTAVVTSGVIFIIVIILGAVIYNRRRKHEASEDSKGQAGDQTQVKPVPQPNKEVSQPEEVTYASVCVKGNNLNNGYVHNEQKNMDVSVIYSTVTIK